jgi:hypothetical protein
MTRAARGRLDIPQSPEMSLSSHSNIIKISLFHSRGRRRHNAGYCMNAKLCTDCENTDCSPTLRQCCFQPRLGLSADEFCCISRATESNECCGKAERDEGVAAARKRFSAIDATDAMATDHVSLRPVGESSAFAETSPWCKARNGCRSACHPVCAGVR